MIIAGTWRLCDDGVTRPVVGAKVLAADGPTYRATWDASPEEMRLAVETGVMPEPDAK
jgi:hypothetical protein